MSPPSTPIDAASSSISVTDVHGSPRVPYGAPSDAQAQAARYCIDLPFYYAETDVHGLWNPYLFHPSNAPTLLTPVHLFLSRYPAYAQTACTARGTIAS
ncbi:hypothetical protein AcW2_004753 [Taiwanofungus camphoratus]|nr:hypothetical protein AcW2_004753 [Antrodia cinnamomea]